MGMRTNTYNNLRPALRSRPGEEGPALRLPGARLGVAFDEAWVALLRRLVAVLAKKGLSLKFSGSLNTT